VHDQDVIVQNTAAAQDDFGGYGLAATFITDKPGPVFKGNTVEGNAGPSTDYGVDGGGMELYDAANTTITGNTFAGNDGVMETGSGSQGRCADDVFTGNAAAGLTSARDQGSNTGLVLRCAANLVVRDNTFTGLDKFTFLLATGGDFAGSIDGLQVQDNTVTRAPGAVVFRLQFDSGTSPALSIDRNRYGSARDSFAIMDTGTGPETPMSFARWRSATAYDAASTLF
jgi:Right handed beta helix region